MTSLKNKAFRLADNAEIVFWENSFGCALIGNDEGRRSVVFAPLGRILSKEKTLSYNEIKEAVCAVFVGGENNPVFSENGLFAELSTLEQLGLIITDSLS